MGTFCIESVWEVPSQTLWIHPLFPTWRHSLTDCVTLAFATTTFCPEEFKFARRGDFALPAPLVWIVYARVPFRKFYPALRISARFLKRHSTSGFASLTVSSMSCRSDHQRKRSAQNGSRESRIRPGFSRLRTG